MRFYSTISHRGGTSLTEAVMRGIAADGGAFMPERIPRLPGALFRNLTVMNEVEIGYIVASTLLGDSLDATVIKDITSQALDFPVPTVKIGSEPIYGYELHHGPTMGYNDAGARFMTGLIDRLKPAGRSIHMLMATAGDSGGSLAQAIAGRDDYRATILYPADTVSPMQEALMNGVDNVTPVMVRGSLSDCLAMIAEALTDPTLPTAMNLTTANAVNIAALLPRIIYYFHGYARLVSMGVKPGHIVIAIPGADPGNLTAGLIARAMGLEIDRFVTAVHADGPGSETRHDLGVSLSDPHYTQMAACPPACCDVVRVRRDEIAAVTDDVFRRHGRVLDPAAAMTWHALSQSMTPGEIGLMPLPVNPCKYDALAKAYRLEPPQSLNRLMVTPRRRNILLPGYHSFRNFLLSKI